ncbi:integral membrane protein [Gracilibacillus boraciitolerans JCM 21714]|uniref:Integral membrane protein n=1 Tax=Gracilibacillus boraciitolerans JCM 21714 TaxID=1298598 RepID=W4VCZ2_9BACI|nr:TerC family protein [Gracilibacillus boraciitolerans]GAE91280.1 integral membrane protein [Gracilibacillus boraciitolerans JCM 21714]
MPIILTTPFVDFDLISLLQIISIDIVLSGDNALVIAMATKSLDKRLQTKAILIGVAGAIILRILFASGIIFLLKFPLIYLIGGILLIWISYKILIKEEETEKIASHQSLLKAILTIIMADVIMSLDNVVAIAGASKGSVSLLAIGVMVSIPLMIFGAKFIVHLLQRYGYLMYLGSAILVYTGVDMLVHEPFIYRFFQLQTGMLTVLISIIITLAVIISGYISNKQIEEQNIMNG